MNETSMDKTGLIRLEFHPLRRSMLVGLLVALSAEFSLNVLIPGFRVSFAVVVLAVLLVTVATQIHTLQVCFFSSVIVLLFRTILMFFRPGLSAAGLAGLLPGALYYLYFGLLFKLQIRNKHTASVGRRYTAFFVCDLFSNILELYTRSVLCGAPLPGHEEFQTVLIVALCRIVLIVFILFLYEEFRRFQTGAERERRYQQLFMIITGLKSELYFMHKNTEEIEQVMGNAYRLHEYCEKQGLPEEICNMAFDIARDVHEIKKDYLRIIRGLESETDGAENVMEMRFRDLLELLRAEEYRVIRQKELDVHLVFDCRDDFVTQKHYQLMTILKNLVDNAVEAIESDKKTGTIFIRERREGGSMILSVEDDGPGITEKQMKRIFRMGYSTKYDEKTGNVFRGVGLPGVRCAVEEELGGTIDISSQPGEKTVFTVTIPVEGGET